MLTLGTIATLLAKGFNSSIENDGSVDGAALVMVGLVVFMMGAFAMWFWGMARRAKRVSQADELIDELERESRESQPTKVPSDDDSSQPWEKKEDWWKNRDRS